MVGNPFLNFSVFFQIRNLAGQEAKVFFTNDMLSIFFFLRFLQSFNFTLELYGRRAHLSRP